MNPVSVFLVFCTSFGLPIAAESNLSTRLGPSRSAPRVKVNIAAREEVKRAMQGYISRDLASLGPVQLVERDPRWAIEIVTMAAEDQEGKVWALGLSVVVLEHGPQMKMLRTLADAWGYILRAGLLQKDQPLEAQFRQLVAAIKRMPESDDPTTLAQHKMCMIPVAELDEACRDIVSSFGARFLHPSEANPGLR